MDSLQCMLHANKNGTRIKDKYKTDSLPALLMIVGYI